MENKSTNNIHFIAIGGALMHNLALALQHKGYNITGSDDEIYDPSYSRLKEAGLLPVKMGWKEENIYTELDAIIVGMHARPNNPELLKAQELGLTIYSYPEYIYLQSQEKKRVVIGGSHGKTTTTSMIMHVLKHHGIDFDYAVGAQIEGFGLMVRLSDAPIIIIEGDEYLSSPIDSLPKFLHYYPHVAVVTGVAWDHINVFPTFKKYKQQFKKFIKSIVENGTLIYYKEDKYLKKYAKYAPAQTIAYTTPSYTIEEHKTYLNVDYNCQLPSGNRVGIPLQIFGKHNLQNFQAARLVCRELGLSDLQIFEAIQAFAGAAKRLETLSKNKNQVVYKDFAHAPSKVKATINAVKGQYPERKLVAVLELHTFSSLNIDFLDEYLGSMGAADEAYVYYNSHTIKMKKLKEIQHSDVEEAFYHPNMKVFTDVQKLQEQLQLDVQKQVSNLLLMSSGNWGGIDILKLVDGK
jgi:UDP-N-acetylmuramate: L-alanyl-gamma-D-glutamyl-meso-diaminopimelate ligase